MLMRVDPFREFDRLTQQLLGGPVFRSATMPLDAYRKDEWFYVHFDLPGVDPDSIDLTVEQNVLTIRATRRAVEEGVEYVLAERPQGEFSRQLFLGENLDTDKLEADYENGVLTVRVPVAEHAKPRKVSISSQPGRAEIGA